MSINLAPLPNGIQLVNTGLTPNDRQGDPLPVAFQKINQNFQLVITRNEDSFSGPVTFQQNVTVMGPMQFNQTFTANQQGVFNALVRFNNTAEFKQTTTFDGSAIFNEAVNFRHIVNFKDDVQFEDPVLFQDIVTFEGRVNLPDGVVKPSDLDSINAPTNDLVLGYNAANGRFAWRAATTSFDPGSSSGSAPSSVGLAEINAPGAAANRVLRISPSGQSLIWSELGGSGGIAAVNLGDIQATAAAPTRVLSITANGQELVWVDVAEQQANSFQNVNEMILHHGDAIRSAGRSSAMLQNQAVERVFNYTLPLGVAANVEGEPPAGRQSSFDIEPPAPLRLVTQQVSQAVQTVAYNFLLVLEGGKGPYNWTVYGDLPPGISISPITQTGQNRIVGTPTSLGIYTINIMVTDSTNPAMRFSTDLSIEVVAPPPTISIVTDVLPEIVAKEESEFEIVSVAGTGNITWSMSAGSLPTGLALVPTTNSRLTIKGKPTEDGTFTFTIQAVDSSTPTPETATRSFTLVVDPEVIPDLEILTTSITRGMRNAAYEGLINFQGGKAPYYLRVIASNLPPGLSLSGSLINDLQFAIQGYPTTFGTNTFTIEIRDSSPTPRTVTQEYEIEIIPDPSNITIVTSAIPTPLLGIQYLVQIAAAAGEGAHAWSISAGTLPPGLSLSQSANGAVFIQGTPTAAGPFNFTIQVQDVTTGSSTRTFIGSVVAPLLDLTYGGYYGATRQSSTRLMNQAWLGSGYRQDFRIRPMGNRFYPLSDDSVVPYYIKHGKIQGSRINITLTKGRLPSGLQFSISQSRYHSITENGTHFSITGVPLEAGLFTFQLQVIRDWEIYYTPGRYWARWYGDVQTLDFALQVNAAVVVGTPTFVTTTLPSVIVGSSFATQVVVEGGTNVVWQTVSGLPTWLSTIPVGNQLRIIGTAPYTILPGTTYSFAVNALVDGTLITNTYPLVISN